MRRDHSSQIHYLDGDCCFAQRADVSLSIWRRPPTPERVEAQRAALQSMLLTHPKILAVTAFRQVDMDMRRVIDRSTQREFEAVAKLVDQRLVAHALIVEGRDFAAMFVRATVSSLGFLMRSQGKAQVFERARDAIEWLVRQREQPVEPLEAPALVAWWAELERAMTSPPPSDQR